MEKQNNNKEKMEKKKIIVGIAGVLLIGVMLISFASAYKLVCLTYGQSLPDSQNPRYTCRFDHCVNICVNDNNYPTNPGYCNDFGACEPFGNSELDVTPPILEVNSPLENDLFTSRGVLFDMTFNEPSTISYLDNINGRGMWKTICSNCESPVSKSVSLKEGFNDVTIRAKDKNGNPAEVRRTFFVDSKKPRINKILPKSKFADGNFQVQYTEENLGAVELIYGNLISGENTVVMPGCVSGEKVWCSIDVDLSSYDGEEMMFHFRITDIAGNIKESSIKKVKVDTTFPVLNNPSSFWEQGSGLYNKYIYFKLDVTEENFDSIMYYDHTDSNPKWKSLCSSIDDEGVCEKKKSFTKGYHHSVDVQIMDDAGNSISTTRLEFDVSD